MKDRTKEQLIRELAEARQKLADLEKSAGRYAPVDRVTREIEEKYAYLLQTVPCAIYSALPDKTGTTTFMSGRWGEWTGCSIDDFRRDPEAWLKCIHPEDRERTVSAYIEACKNKKEFVAEYRAVHRDTAKIYYLKDHGVPIMDESGEIIRVDGVVTDVTAMRAAQEKESRNIGDLLFLSKSAVGFVELSLEEDIYHYIARQLKEFVGNCVILVSDFNETNQVFQLRDILGLEKLMEVVRLLGCSPVGMTTPISDEARVGLTSGRLEKISGGIYALSGGSVPSPVCMAVEKMLGISSIYGMGFSWKGRLFGSAVILMRKGSVIRNPGIIETFIHQASVALQRRQAEEALRKANDELERRVSERTAELAKANEKLVLEINDRNRAEEALRESERFLSNVLSNVPTPITVRYSDTSIRYVNPAFEKLTGFSLAEIKGKKSSLPWWIEDRADEDYTALIEDLHKDAPTSRPERQFRKKNGERFWVMVSNAPIMDSGELVYLTNWVDITEHKKAEEALQVSEEFSSTLLNASPNPVLVINPDTSIRYINPALEKLTGFTLAEVVGKKPPYPWWTPDIPVETVREFMTDNRYTVERRLCKKNGDVFWVEITTSSVRRNGQPQYLIISWSDITERKDAQLQLQEKNRQLDNQNVELRLRAEQLMAQQRQLSEKTMELEKANQAKSDFCASMSHELRTPLNAVMGFTQLILDGITGEINAEQKGCLSDILNSSQHLLNLINDVMDLTRIEARKIEFKFERINLADVVNEAVHTVRPMLDDCRHELEVSIDRLPEVRADKKRLTQILVNLLHNATKFTLPGGRIVVQARQAGDCCQVCVADSGIGIKDEDRERIFEAFVQVDTLPDKAKEGVGLGLALVKQLVEACGGKIWVNSKYGEGSKFTFTLPLAQ